VENFIRWYVAFRLRQPEILPGILDYDELIAIAREKLSVTKGFQIALNPSCGSGFLVIMVFRKPH